MIRPLGRIPQTWITERTGEFFATRRQPIQIEDLIEVLDSYLDADAIDDVRRAYEYGAKAHEGQKRRSGEPYIHHPISVAKILADMHLDSRSLMAALLHDVVEDTDNSLNQLASHFGDDVAHLVDGVSKIGMIEFESPEQAEAENFRKMLLAMSRDIRVILIKLADRLHNMRTLGALDDQRKRRIARQTLEIFAPIANRLGMYDWCSELEDLSFEHLHPKRFRTLAAEVKKRQGNRRSAITKIKNAIEAMLEERGISAVVEGRKKSVYSIYKKMKRKGLPFEEILDLHAIRIVVDNVDDCYRTLGYVHAVYNPIAGRIKDYIAIPKTNGYQSLHTTVFGSQRESIEVQIRTEEMHRIAVAGVASNWLYKNESEGAEPVHSSAELGRQWVLDLLDTQHKSGDPREFLEHLKVDLFPDQVYVFTPEGEIKQLPMGATALDFAYAVHSDLGDRCVGAQVDNKQVPLHHKLRNGDRVEILTARNTLPSPSWLNYAVTGKARSAIRSTLKNRRQREAVVLGRKLLDRALTSIGHRRRLSSNHKVHLLDSLGLASWEDLLADIGFGERPAMVVARQLVPADADGDEVDGNTVKPLAIRGAEKLLITYGKCCHPIPGDPIIGYFGIGRGLVVHTTDCPNTATYRKHPERSVPLHWADSIEMDFPVTLRLDTMNQPGALAEAATAIAEAGSNIVNVNVVERDGRNSTLNFTIEVSNRKHLADIMRTLRAQPAVNRQTRTKG